MNRSYIVRLFILAAMVLVVASAASAQVPAHVSQQIGQVLDSVQADPSTKQDGLAKLRKKTLEMKGEAKIDLKMKEAEKRIDEALKMSDAKYRENRDRLVREIAMILGGYYKFD